MNQVAPYLPFAKTDIPLRNLICGVINRMASDVLTDTYANAFNYGEEGGDYFASLSL